MAIWRPALRKLEEGAGDGARAVGAVEVVDDEGAIAGKHDRPRVAKVAVAAVIAQNQFGGGGGVGAFGVQDTCADAERFVAISVDEQDAFVWQLEGVVRMAAEAGIAPLEALAAIGGARDAGVTPKLAVRRKATRSPLGVS